MQEATGLLNSLETNTPFSQNPLLSPLLFQKYKMNEMINKFLLTWDKRMPEMHLRQPGFTFGACCSFTKTRERIKKF